MTEKHDWEAELLCAISNLVCVLNQGRITYINPAGITMLSAKDADAVLGHELADFVHADYADLLALGIEAFAEEEAGIPLKLRPINASPIDVQMRVRELKDRADGDYMVECRDISNYIRASEDARRREQRLGGVLATVGDAIITIDQKGIMQTVNPAAERMFGYAKNEMIAQNVKLLMPDQYADHHDQYLDHHVKSGESRLIGRSRELEGQHKDGTRFPIELSVTELREGTQRLFTGVVRDITERRKAQEKIEHLAHHDPLTGLPNRNLFTERMERAIYRAKRSGKPLGLMFVDLDKFKPINDQLGHEAGDTVLKTVAERMAHCVRTSDTVARIGGDEFVAILENLDHWESAAVVAQKIIRALTQPIDVSTNKTAQVGASIGIAIFPGDGNTLDDLSRAADVAMYAVKEAGRNNFKFFNQLNSAA
ncbi:MAG: diguanylate cyclase [Rhodospirillales bacterium]|nr:diguanylate cyclase [Rhodospirillales bacterium]